MTKAFPPKIDKRANSKAQRDDRLAAALKANIKRRKDGSAAGMQAKDDGALPVADIDAEKCSDERTK